MNFITPKTVVVNGLKMMLVFVLIVFISNNLTLHSVTLLHTLQFKPRLETFIIFTVLPKSNAN